MNQEQNNLNTNNFNTEGNNVIPNSQSLNNQSFNNTFNQTVSQNNGNQSAFNQYTNNVNTVDVQTTGTSIQNQNIQQETYATNSQGITNTTTQVYTQPNINSNLQTSNAIQPQVIHDTNSLNSNKKENSNKNKKLLVFILIGVILLIGVLLLIIKLLGNNKEKQGLYDAFSAGIIKIEKDNKYGFIDTNGNIITECIYDYATDFYGNYAIVSNKEEKQFGYDDTLYTVINYYFINTKGEVVLTSNDSTSPSYEYQRIDNHDRWLFNGKLYDNNLNQLSPDNVIVKADNIYRENYDYLYWVDSDKNKVGIISIDGKITYTLDKKSNTWNYTLGIGKKNPLLKEQYCSLTYYDSDYKSNIINCETGKVVLDFVDGDFIVLEGNIFSNSFFSDEGYLCEYYYVENDKILFHVGPTRDASIYYDKDGYLSIREDNSKEYYYYDLKTKKKTNTIPKGQDDDIKYEDLYDMSLELINLWENYTGYSLNKCTSGVGLTKNNKEILSCNWNKIKFLNLDLYKYLESKGKSYIYVYKDGKWHLYDIKKQEIVFDMDYYSITESNVSTIIYFKTDNNKKILNLLTLNSIDVGAYDTVNIYNGYFTVKENSKLHYYNNDFKLIYTKELAN